MHFLDISLNFIEIIILQIGGIILGIAVHFFIASRKELKKTIASTSLSQPITFSISKKKEDKQKELEDVKGKLISLKRNSKKEIFEDDFEIPAKQKPTANPEALDIEAIKQVIVLQQGTLNKLLGRIDKLQESSDENLELQNKELVEDIEKLEMDLEQKEAELKKLKQQEAVSQKMISKIDEVYKEFESLQQKIISLEEQAHNANTLQLELEEIRQSYEQVKNDLTRKQQKLDETIEENQRLHQQLDETEDKLSEANLQRQQLFKKVHFLEEINNDFQDINESNKKLQNEMRRIGELESMLNMIVEERDQLLKKRSE